MGGDPNLVRLESGLVDVQKSLGELGAERLNHKAGRVPSTRGRNYGRASGGGLQDCPVGRPACDGGSRARPGGGDRGTGASTARGRPQRGRPPPWRRTGRNRGSVAAGRRVSSAFVGERRCPATASASAPITGRAGTGVRSATIENCTAAKLKPLGAPEPASGARAPPDPGEVVVPLLRRAVHAVRVLSGNARCGGATPATPSRRAERLPRSARLRRRGRALGDRIPRSERTSPARGARGGQAAV